MPRALYRCIVGVGVLPLEGEGPGESPARGNHPLLVLGKRENGLRLFSLSPSPSPTPPDPDPEPNQSFRPFALLLRIAVGEGYADDSLAKVSPAPVRGEMFRARRVAGESAPPAGELGAARPEADTTTGRSELELVLALALALGFEEEDPEGWLREKGYLGGMTTVGPHTGADGGDTVDM